MALHKGGHAILYGLTLALIFDNSIIILKQKYYAKELFHEKCAGSLNAAGSIYGHVFMHWPS